AASGRPARWGGDDACEGGHPATPPCGRWRRATDWPRLVAGREREHVVHRAEAAPEPHGHAAVHRAGGTVVVIVTDHLLPLRAIRSAPAMPSCAPPRPARERAAREPR